MDANPPFRVPPPGLFAAAVGLQLLLTRGRSATPRSRTAAAVIAAAGAALGASTIATLRANGTTVSPEHPERTTTLVQAGPFAHTRNPAYLALAGMLVAHAVLRRSAAALLPAAAFVAVIDRAQIPAEEAALQRRFGCAYTRYRRAVPRWIGRGDD